MFTALSVRCLTKCAAEDHFVLIFLVLFSSRKNRTEKYKKWRSVSRRVPQMKHADMRRAGILLKYPFGESEFPDEGNASCEQVINLKSLIDISNTRNPSINE
jgi:hypothetical protein